MCVCMRVSESDIWECNQWPAFKSCQSKRANEESTLQTIDLHWPTQTRIHTQKEVHVQGQTNTPVIGHSRTTAHSKGDELRVVTLQNVANNVNTV